MPFKAICLMIFSLCFGGVTAVEALEVCGEVKQGELILLKDKNSKKISVFKNLNRKNYSLNEEGIALVALHRDAPQKLEFGAYSLTDASDVYELNVAKTKWDIQRVDGVEQHHVTPNKKHQTEIVREQKDVRHALGQKNMAQYWREGFIVPVDGRISGQFGNQRIFNGVPKNPHSGTDIAAPLGTPVKASGSGVVVLSGKDYFYTGNMVILDHGQGLQTIYAHLQDLAVQKGEVVRQGQIIGHVGKSGRATGAHLHWGASLNNVRFRPHSLLDIDKKKCRQYSGKYMGE